MTRTDAHAPSSTDFDPQLYTCVDVIDFCTDPMQGGSTPQERQAHLALITKLQEQGFSFADHVGRSHTCGHCGARLRYAALLQRDDVQELIYVGETCLDGRFEMTKGEFQAKRKQSQLDREQMKLKTAFLALCNANPALAWATYAVNIEIGIERDFADLQGQKVLGRDARYLGTTPEDHRLAANTSFNTVTMHDIARKARQYGDASAKQIAFVERLVNEIETKVADYRAKIDARNAAPAAPALTAGRQVIEGEVLVVKEQEGYMPGSSVTKMLVKLDGGQRVWGSVPSAIWNTGKGDRVRFTATVEAKDGEADFGFFSRPTKAETLSVAAELVSA
jgi:hypothetical protein